MKENIVIGIEGDVSSGKTSICKELINLIPNSIFIDGGNIYRGIIEAILKSGIDMSNMSNIANINPFDIMKKLQVEFKIEDKITEIYIAGNKINEDEIQSMQNSVGVSKVASTANNKALFMFARGIVEQYKKNYNIIVSARDLVDIYPEMDAHVLVTASLEERAKRRYKQYNGKYTLEEVTNIIKQRDEMHAKAGFNKTCKNTITVDVTECPSAEKSAKKVLKKITDKGLINI